MSELKQRKSTLLLLAEIACLAIMLLPTWQRIARPGGGEVTVIRMGLPFSSWITGTQTWNQAEVANVWDFDGAVQVHFWSWSWLVLVLGVIAGRMRRSLRSPPGKSLNLAPARPAV